MEPAANGPPAGVSASRARLRELDSRRLRIESELSGALAQLEGMQGSPGLAGPLTDAEGFPRSDVDIVAARRLRQRHAVLQTDIRAVMGEIERELAALHAAARDAGAVSPGRPQQPARRAPGAGAAAPRENGGAPAPAGLESATPLAVVSSVVPGSPADAAGLRAGDAVMAFGPATAADAGHSLEDIAAATRASEDRELVAYVLREGSALVMVRITPSSDWPGQGLLGCHLARTPR